MVGDGAMQMNGNAELVTAAKYWKQWSDPRLIICVLNNHDLNQVTWEQRVMEGDPMYPGTQEIPEFPYARYAELIGFTGIRVDDPNDLGAAWDRALASDRPVVLEAITDPSVPPLPPHITIEQAKQLASALTSGEPRARDVIKRSFAGKAKEFLVRN
jgi:pyruvate dehydrogenase (quinone)